MVYNYDELNSLSFDQLIKVIDSDFHYFSPFFNNYDNSSNEFIFPDDNNLIPHRILYEKFNYIWYFNAPYKSDDKSIDIESYQLLEENPN